jgi:uncharacterized paraquat-inducible protein A
MEICQHCEMYMEPIIVEANNQDNKRAKCEFCGKTIATKINGKWVKLKPNHE